MGIDCSYGVDMASWGAVLQKAKLWTDQCAILYLASLPVHRSGGAIQL